MWIEGRPLRVFDRCEYVSVDCVESYASTSDFGVLRYVLYH
jgi:hypothetical protein